MPAIGTGRLNGLALSYNNKGVSISVENIILRLAKQNERRVLLLRLVDNISPSIYL